MGHTYSNLLVHAVFGTKDRRPTIHDSFRTRFHEYLGGIARSRSAAQPTTSMACS